MSGFESSNPETLAVLAHIKRFFRGSSEIFHRIDRRERGAATLSKPPKTRQVFLTNFGRCVKARGLKRAVRHGGHKYRVFRRFEIEIVLRGQGLTSNSNRGACRLGIQRSALVWHDGLRRDKRVDGGAAARGGGHEERVIRRLETEILLRGQGLTGISNRRTYRLEIQWQVAPRITAFAPPGVARGRRDSHPTKVRVNGPSTRSPRRASSGLGFCSGGSEKTVVLSRLEIELLLRRQGLTSISNRRTYRLEIQ
jgi:hypothetical protein